MANSVRKYIDSIYIDVNLDNVLRMLVSEFAARYKPCISLFGMVSRRGDCADGDTSCNLDRVLISDVFYSSDVRLELIKYMVHVANVELLSENAIKMLLIDVSDVFAIEDNDQSINVELQSII